MLFLQGLFSNALRNYFLFFYKQTQKSSGQPRLRVLHKRSAVPVQKLLQVRVVALGLPEPAPRGCEWRSSLTLAACRRDQGVPMPLGAPAPGPSSCWFPLCFSGSGAVGAAVIWWLDQRTESLLFCDLFLELLLHFVQTIFNPSSSFLLLIRCCHMRSFEYVNGPKLVWAFKAVALFYKLSSKGAVPVVQHSSNLHTWCL